MSAHERLLLVNAARGGALTNASARALTGLDSQDVRRSLAKLRDEGLLIQHGARGGSTYTLGSIAQSRTLVSRERLEQVVLEAARAGGVTNQWVREQAGLRRHEALRLLGDLVERGLLVQHGERRGTRYTAAPSPQD